MYYFSSNEWLQLHSAPASKRLHTLVTRSLQLGCKRPSEKTLAIFFALGFFEQGSLFGGTVDGKNPVPIGVPEKVFCSLICS